jgi:hypothetical protein
VTFCIQATWDDVPHLSQKMKDDLWSKIPAHQRDARAKGIPVLGSGRVFPISEEEIKVEPFSIPGHWPLIGGIDFGWDHPTAAAKLAWDRDTDTIYVVAAYARREATPVIHAGALKAWGSRLPWSWPHDGLQHEKGSGSNLAVQYREQGLNLLPERATFQDGSFGVEAGISEMLSRMETGRWKVFKHLTEWFDEFRLYHRKNGLIVKLLDDRISASRYAMMMLRHAATDSRINIPKRNMNWVA